MKEQFISLAISFLLVLVFMFCKYKYIEYQENKKFKKMLDAMLKKQEREHKLMINHILLMSLPFLIQTLNAKKSNSSNNQK